MPFDFRKAGAIFTDPAIRNIEVEIPSVGVDTMAPYKGDPLQYVEDIGNNVDILENRYGVEVTPEMQSQREAAQRLRDLREVGFY